MTGYVAPGYWAYGYAEGEVVSIVIRGPGRHIGFQGIDRSISSRSINRAATGGRSARTSVGRR
jgi:hypothetical protein